MEFLTRLFKQSPARGNTCRMCGGTIYGEETVIAMQKQAVYVQRDLYGAQRIEQQSGYRCKSCGREYCKDCLERKAPGNIYGGKSCPSCGGRFEIMHG